MQHAPTDAADPLVKNLAIGLDMTEKELVQAFERNGLKKIDPPRGAKFDPHLHQAMMEQPSDDVPGGGVIQVMQAGYELFGRIVRPAMVIVAAKSGKADTPSDAPAANPYASAGDADSGGSVDTTGVASFSASSPRAGEGTSTLWPILKRSRQARPLG